MCAHFLEQHSECRSSIFHVELSTHLFSSFQIILMTALLHLPLFCCISLVFLLVSSSSLSLSLSRARAVPRMHASIHEYCTCVP